MSYSGGQVNTNWMTLAYGGVTNPTVTTEQIPVLVDGLTTYSFSVVAAIDNTHWASGFQTALTFYNASGGVISTITASSGDLIAGVQHTVATAPTAAPGGASYCAAFIELNGSPASTNPLDVYYAAVVTGNNTYIPDVVNYNYAFINGTWPWAPSNGAVINNVNVPLSGAGGNPDSLVIGGIIELMGGAGVPCVIPNLTDQATGNSAVYRISTPGGQLQTLSGGGSGPYNLGDFQPTQDFVESLLLDGERPFGSRSSNRQMDIPIAIYAPTQQTLNAARDYLLSVIDQQQFEVAWTPAATGLTTVYECFRALPSTIMYGFNNLREGAPGAPAIGLVTVSIQALPYGKSGIDGVVEIDFSSGLANGQGVVTPAILDSFTEAPCTFTRTNYALPVSVTTSFNITSNTVPAGGSIVVEVASVTNNVTGVTDAVGNVYTLASTAANGNNTMYEFIFVAYNVAALTSQNITIAITGSAASYMATAYSVPANLTFISASHWNGSTSTISETFGPIGYGDTVITVPFSIGTGGFTGSQFPYDYVSINFGNSYDDLVFFTQSASNQTLNFTSSGFTNPWGLIMIRFSTTAIDNKNGWLKNTQYPIIGSGCAFHREPFPAKAPYAPLLFQQSFPAISIVGLPVLALWFGQSYDSQFAADPKFTSNVTFAATLYDALGRSIGCQATVNKVAWNSTPTKPTWTQISMTIPQRSTKFSYNAVVGYKLKMTNWTGGGQSGFVRMNAWLGYVSANPMSITSSTAPRGILYNMFGLAGSARAAINAQVQLPNTDVVTQEFTQSGFFQVPAGVTNLEAECWGAGGAGSTNNNNTYPAGGGGGGEYAMEPSIVVTPGQKIPMTVGAGGTPALVTPTVQTFNTHGVATNWTAPPFVDRALIECWGGGAAGAPGGGGGGAGGYTQSLVNTTPGQSYTMWVGNGGQPNTGKTSQALASRGGQNTWFGNSGTKAISAAIVGAYGGASAVAGSSTGGAGGKGYPSQYITDGNPNYVATVATGSVTTQVVSWNAGTQTIQKGESAICLVSTLDAPGVTVSDPVNGNWLYIGGAFNTNSTVNAFYLQSSKATIGPSTNQVTVTRVGSGVMVIGIIDFPWTSVLDVTAVRGTAGTTTTPAVASGTPLSDCNTYLAIFCGSTSHISSTPTGYTALTQLGSGPYLDATYETLPTATAQTAISSYGSSQACSALMLPMSAGLSYTGGHGGRSPGGAGGGGGASGSYNGTGGQGGSSPKLGTSASGDYLTGGAGGTGPGGNGGVGANVPGAASGGHTPGGAGGGGYTKTTSAGGHTNAVNYQGAVGAPGQIRISYIPNNNVPVSGGNTIFGSSGTTSAIVTAHGGTSAGWNTVFGGIGGTGSSNTSHYFGGRGALTNRVNNGMMAATAANAGNLAVGTSTSSNQLTLTSGSSLTSSYMESGVMLVVPVISSTTPSNPVATDNAGHSYYLASQQVLTDGSCLSVFVTALKFPIVSSQVFTLSTSNAISTAAYWAAITGVRDLEDTVIGTNAGNSGTQSVTRTYPDDTAVYFEYQVIANNAGSGALGGQNGYPGVAVASGVINGNLAIGGTAIMRNGSGTALTTSGSMGGSMPWATIALPFMVAAQTQQILPITPQATGYTGTTGTYTNGTNTGNFNLDNSTGYMLVAVHGASSTTSTIGVTDSASNVYTLLETVAAGSGAVYIFGGPVVHDLVGAWTMTVTSSVSQGYDINAFFVPGGTAADATGKGTNNATGTAVSLTYPGVTKANSVQFAMVGYGSTTDQLSAPAWTNNLLPLQLATSIDASRTMSTDYFINAGIGFSGSAFTATLGSSLGWGAAMVSVVVPQWSGGGGSSAGAGGYGIDGTNGQSGGGPAYNSGGKGANGVLGTNNGLIGSVPGGGGSGGALVGAGVALGGPGGNGMIRVTHQPPLIAFNDWLLHRPGLLAPADLVPLVPIPPADPPDNREYAIPSTVIGRNARFNGTYTVMLCAATWNTPANSRRISVTVNQYEYPGGPGVSVQATRTLTPATDIVNGYVSMGEVTLPIKQIADSNTDGYYTVSIHDTNQSDGFQDLIFLDTQGATCLVNIAPGTAGDSQYSNFYYDEPGLDTDLGKLLGSSHERDRAISVLDMAMVTGGPLYVTTGNNLLLVYSSKGAPNLRVTYSPRWYSDRII